MQIFINTYGTSLRIIDGMLSIKSKDKIEKVPLGKVQKIYLTKSVAMSSDILYNCIDNAIDLVITERDGTPIGRLWNNKFGSISSLRRKQLHFSRSKHATPWVTEQIIKKGRHQIEVLLCLYSLPDYDKNAIQGAIDKITNNNLKLEQVTNENVADAAPSIRAIEGNSARTYFRTVSMHLPFRFQFKKRTGRPAQDMINAMLNYVYGILYSHVEAALIKAGLDPFIGIFHRDEYNRPVLTYDVIEVFRPWADWVVFHLCINEVLDEDMFLVENGTYWIQGEAKGILIQHFTDFFEEVVAYEQHKFNRFTHIQRLATKLSSHINKKVIL